MNFAPFVLKCPECTAPSEEFATHCRYCKTPLVWRPVISLSSFENYRVKTKVQEDDGPQRPVLPFGPQPVAPDQTMVFQIQTQLPFKPDSLHLPPSIVEHVLVEDIRIGVRSQFISPAPIPGWAFSPNNPSAKMSFDAAYPGQFITIHIKNVSHHHITVSGIFRGSVAEVPRPPMPTRMRSFDDPSGRWQAQYLTNGRR